MHKVVPETYPSMSESKKVKIYPTFRLGDDDLPELKDMEVGKKYTLVMEVEVKSKAQGNEWGGEVEVDKQIRAVFKVMKVGCEEKDAKAKKGTVAGKTFEMDYAKRRSGGTGSRFDK